VDETADYPPEIMTSDETAEYLRVSKSTLYAWQYHGTGPRASRVGKHLRYRKSDVDRWLDAQVA